MLLTPKLLSFINRVFDKDPRKFLALRLSYGGGMTWNVQDAVLTTNVQGGIGAPLNVDLTQYTLADLVGYLAAQPGYSVPYADAGDNAQLSARILLDGSGDIAVSNGDHLYGYTNVLWAYLEAASSELARAKAQIAEMLQQMSTTTAGDVWLDELGGYYGIPRISGEADASYGPRIITEVLRPRENNVAMEAAIKAFSGQNTTVTDVTEWSSVAPLYNGSEVHDGSILHNAAASPLYGLFDVVYGYDLENGGSLTEFAQLIRDLIDRLRAAGTHLRALSLSASSMSDAFTHAPSDASAMSVGAAMTDPLTAPTESTTIGVAMVALTDTAVAGLDGLAAIISTNYTYSGLRLYNGAITHQGISTNAEDIGSPGDIPFSGVLVLDGSFNLDGSQLIDGLI
jgi:hypothetical protein